MWIFSLFCHHISINMVTTFEDAEDMSSVLFLGIWEFIFHSYTQIRHDELLKTDSNIFFIVNILK